MTSKTIRETTRVVTAHRQREGAGFIVRRPVPAPGLDVADPFLLLDEMGPVDYGPGEAVGALATDSREGRARARFPDLGEPAR